MGRVSAISTGELLLFSVLRAVIKAHSEEEASIP